MLELICFYKIYVTKAWKAHFAHGPPRVKEGPFSVVYYFMVNIRQDAGIRTRYSNTAARFATNELHTSLTNKLHQIPNQ